MEIGNVYMYVLLPHFSRRVRYSWLYSLATICFLFARSTRWSRVRINASANIQYNYSAENLDMNVQITFRYVQ